jgi:tRNA A37 methylthiotransferase MiaB
VLDQEKRTAFYQQYLGTTQRVLVERKAQGAVLMKGFTENYIPVQFSGNDSLAGTIVPVRLSEVKDSAVVGKLMEV